MLKSLKLTHGLWLVNFVNSIIKLKDYFNNLEEVKRIKELKPYIENNNDIKALMNELQLKQKQIVNAKEFNQFNQLKIYNLEYEKIKEELYNIPFVEEYIELVDYVNNLLNELVNEIDFKLDKLINEK